MQSFVEGRRQGWGFFLSSKSQHWWPTVFFPNNILGTSACFVDTDYQVVTVVLVVRPLPLMPAETWPLNVSHSLKWTLLFERVFTCMRGVKRCFCGTGLLLTDFCWMIFVEKELQKNVNWISCWKIAIMSFVFVCLLHFITNTLERLHPRVRVSMMKYVLSFFPLQNLADVAVSLTLTPQCNEFFWFYIKCWFCFYLIMIMALIC